MAELIRYKFEEARNLGFEPDLIHTNVHGVIKQVVHREQKSTFGIV